MKKYILMFAASMMLVSCVDTHIIPDDKTVDEDFWKTKEDVSAMVNAAYAAMADNNVLIRLLIWGDFRSDEFVRAATPTGDIPDALAEIAAVNIQTTNTFAEWASVYAAINRCNIVLERAKEVMSIDPNYTLGDYQVDCSQMLALRALCYFYLVRNFRDVPYIDYAYTKSSQDRMVTQSAPDVVIDHCIADLEEAAKSPISARSYTTSEWRRVGWLTDDGINAILADIYLWRASVKHSQADYQRCVEYCDKVIESKKSQHVRGRNEIVAKEYPLADAADAYIDIFFNQNAEESIFELQSRSNTAVGTYLYKYQNAADASGEGFIKATQIFGGAVTSNSSVGFNQVFSNIDLRYYAACYLPSDGEESYDVRKMISENAITNKTAVTAREAYGSGGLNRNCIIYRLTDLMLMKAEALVQQVDTTLDADTQAELLREPFTLVQTVNTRSLYRENLSDSLKWNTFKGYNKDQMELLVMEERLRELCFEGKRWYDLLRYNYRHVEGIDYSRTLAEINDADEPFVSNYSEMLNLATRGRGAEASGVQAKMANECYLYMPVPNADIIVCPVLRQNPVYKETSEYEKNY